MNSILSIFTVLLSALVKFSWATDVNFNLEEFENLNVVRTINAVNPYIHEVVNLKVENVGADDAARYLYVIPKPEAESLAKIFAIDVNDNPLAVRKLETHGLEGYEVFEIVFVEPLQPLQSHRFVVNVAYSRGARPLPAEAKQSESQWLVYEGFQNFISPYKTRKQAAQMNLVTEKFEVLKFDARSASSSSDDDEANLEPSLDPTGFLNLGVITQEVPSLERRELAIRFENPLAMPFVENLNRTVWVSHWGGSVSFDESYDIHNIGTKVKSPFSRLNFAKPKVGFSLNTAALQGIRIRLPEDGSREHYFVDLVGNVSTSVVNEKTLDAIPRYPIMGGWFYNFTVGWAADLGNFVRKASPSNYVLKVPVIGGPEGTAYGRVFTTIVLPEHAQKVEMYSDTPYHSVDLSNTYSYLDHGRPTITIGYKNLVSEQASESIYVTYQYSLLSALRKPLSYTLAIASTLILGKAALKLF